MTEHEGTHEQELASYLAGELKPHEQESFRALLDDDPELAVDADSLQRTLASLRALDAPATGGQRDRSQRTRPFRAWGMSIARYAALIGLSFAAGYFLRGQPIDDSDPIAPTAVGELAIDQVPTLPAPDSWLHEAAEVYVERQRGSGFARSLLALSSISGSGGEKPIGE